MLGKRLLSGRYIQLLPDVTTNIAHNLEAGKRMQWVNTNPAEELIMTVGIQPGNQLFVRK